jgi:hypothetical protein
MELSKFLAHSRRVETDDLDWALASRVGVTDDEAALLAHIANIEDQTPFYMLELMNTPARLDLDTVGFLTMWNYEEYFHARAIQQLLERCGRPTAMADAVAVRRRVTFRARFEDLAQRLIARVTPRGFTALYFTWGASQEFLTTHVYETIAARTANPVLAELCLRIAKQERRHYAWYYNSAKENLARSTTGQRLTRFIMNRIWTPVGVGVKSEDENAWVLSALFGGEHEELFDKLQDKLTALPGLATVDRPRRYAQAVSRRLARSDDEDVAQAEAA